MPAEGVARDDRPWAGPDPPAVVYTYAPGRQHEHARVLLGGYRGILQCDGYGAYKTMVDPTGRHASCTLAFCWSHVRRGFYDLAKSSALSQPRRCGGSPRSIGSRPTSAARAPRSAAPRARRAAGRCSRSCIPGSRRNTRSCRAEGIVRLLVRVTNEVAGTALVSCAGRNLSHLTPDAERSIPGITVIGGGETMTAKLEVVVDTTMNREEALCMAH